MGKSGPVSKGDTGAEHISDPALASDPAESGRQASDQHVSAGRAREQQPREEQARQQRSPEQRDAGQHDGRPHVAGRVMALMRRHWVFGVLLAAGAALRIVTMLAYAPALLYIDSFRYVYNLDELDPTRLNPVGYQLFLLKPALFVTKSLQAVVLIQHLLGLAIAVAIYLLLIRRGARRWVAAVAAAPVLLDAYQVQIEHNIMSDLLFEVLLLAVVVLLLWRGAPTAPVAAVAGLLLAAAVITRVVALPLIVPALVYVLVAAKPRLAAGRRPLLRRVGAAAALTGFFAVGVFSYAVYHYTESGEWGITGAKSRVLYGRTATVADCSALNLNPAEKPLCPKEPVDERPGVDVYAHGLDGWDPEALKLAPEYGGLDATTTSFAYKVLAAQPFDVAEAVFEDIMKSFALTRETLPGDVPVERWQFQTEYPRWGGTPPEKAIADFGGPPISVNTDLAAFLRGYQLSVGYVPGVVLGGFLLLSVAGMVGIGRARRSALRSACLLTGGFGAALIVTSAAFEFSWRYQLPTYILLPLAGALGWTALTRKDKPEDGPPAERPAADDPQGPEDTDTTVAFPSPGRSQAEFRGGAPSAWDTTATEQFARITEDSGPPDAGTYRSGTEVSGPNQAGTGEPDQR